MAAITSSCFPGAYANMQPPSTGTVDLGTESPCIEGSLDHSIDLLSRNMKGVRELFVMKREELAELYRIDPRLLEHLHSLHGQFTIYEIGADLRP